MVLSLFRLFIESPHKFRPQALDVHVPFSEDSPSAPALKTVISLDELTSCKI